MNVLTSSLVSGKSTTNLRISKDDWTTLLSLQNVSTTKSLQAYLTNGVAIAFEIRSNP